MTLDSLLDYDILNKIVLGYNKTLFVTMTNNGYIDYTLNMLKSLEKIGLDKKILCVCIDIYSYEKLKDNYVTLLLDTKNHEFCPFFQGKYVEIVRFKFFIVNELLKKGYNILFTDGDIVYKKNPIEYIDNILKDEKIDLVIQNDSDSDNNQSYLCTGFYFIRSNYKSIGLFDISLYKKENTCDQSIFNNEIKHKLNYKVLPIKLFPNGYYFYRNGNIDEQYLVHFNYVIGHEKKQKMCQYGLWLI